MGAVTLPNLLNTVIESDYADDSRVVWQGEGFPPDILAVIPDEDENNSRAVMLRDSADYVVIGAINPDAGLYDPGDRYNQRLWAFDSLDIAIAMVIGEPQ